MKAPFKPYAAIIFAELCWGFSFIWTQQLAGKQQIPVFVLIFVRMLISAIAMIAISLLVRSRLKIERQDVKWFLLLAFFEPFLYFIGETFGIKATNSPTLSALIIAVIPIVTMFADMLFYKTKLAAIAKFGVLLTLPGTLLMVLKKDPSTSVYWWGIALLMLAVFASCSFLITKGDFPVATLFQAPAIGPLLCLAILCSCGAFSCYVFSIKNIGITRACIFSATIPIVSASASYFMGIETFNWVELLGIGVVITGVILAQRGQKNAAEL